MNRPTAPSNASADTARQVRAYPSVSRPTQFRTSHVLLIDDDPMQRKLMGRMLESLGCFVEQRSSTVGVAELITNEPERYDIIVSDYEMPDGDGMSLVRELNTLVVRRPPFLLCTGAAVLPRDAWSATDGVLAKPYTRDQLQEVLERCLVARLFETH